MKKTAIIFAGLLLALAPPAALGAGPGRIQVSWFSQQDGRTHAAAGTQIDVHSSRPGHPATRSRPTATSAVHVSTGASSKTIGGTTNVPSQEQPRYPPLPANSPVLKKTQPVGPGSFWYQDGAGHVCLYAPNSVLPCFTITGTGNTGPAAAPLTPVTIAAHVADRMALSPGQLKASPSGAGLSGAASWFWLDPAPATERLTVSLAGEAVTVTAVPQVEWQFGDRSGIDGGAGVPYRSGPVVADAITHVYDTRCLPGDQGHDPYVLSTCGNNGYQLVATVSWKISYQADGPVAATGRLPSRTTTSSADYPVSEARAFLVKGTAR
jgi:hypothetical protein